MKKFLLGAVGLMGLSLVGFGMIAPAMAADLPASPYKAAPAMIAGDLRLEWPLCRPQRRLGIKPQVLGHDRSGRRIRLRRWLSRCDRRPRRRHRSVFAGRPAVGCSVSKLRATGPIFAARAPACSRPAIRNRSRIDAFGLFTGQVGYAFDTALLYVKGGGARGVRSFRSGDDRDERRCRHGRQPKSLGWHRRRRHRICFRCRTGRLPSNTIICSCEARPRLHRSGRRSVRCSRPHPSGCRSRHRARELPLGRPGHREVLIVDLG